MLEYTIDKSQFDELTERLNRIEENTTPKPEEITKESILAIKDRTERQRAINEHLELFL